MKVWGIARFVAVADAKNQGIARIPIWIPILTRPHNWAVMKGEVMALWLFSFTT